MDPREYIPYLEELDKIENQIEKKSKICIDLKLYNKAIDVLSEGDKN